MQTGAWSLGVHAAVSLARRARAVLGNVHDRLTLAQGALEGRAPLEGNLDRTGSADRLEGDAADYFIQGANLMAASCAGVSDG